MRDFRHAWRTIWRMPMVSVVVVVSLAVGIAANTVVFSWIEAVILRPIPAVRDSGQFYFVQPRTDAGLYTESSWLEFRDLRERLRLMPELLAFRMVPLYLGEPGQVVRGNALLVSGNYFSALGLRPALGRFITPGEAEHAGREPVAVISYDYWQTRFGGDPGAIGQTMRINGQQIAIVGVAPRGFQGTILRLSFDFWLPATLTPTLFNGSRDLEDRSVRAYSVMGRLTGKQYEAQAELDAAMRDLATTYPQTNTNLLAELLPYGRAPRGPQRLLATSLTLLQGLMVLLLLAVCGNTANLMLTRGSARQREMSVRLALGATRWRIASLLLTENLTLAVAGALLGAAIAIWATSALSALPPMRVRGIPISLQSAVSGTGLLFAVLLGIACGLIFGLAPAVQLARSDPQITLRAGSSTAPRSLLRHALMAGEVCLAVIVLVVAGISYQRFMETRGTDTGFTRDGVLLAAYDLAERGTDSSARVFAARLTDRLRALPAVKAVAIATSVPLDIHGLPTRFFTLEGRARTDGTLDQALANTVTPGYFAVMGIPFRAGTDFANLSDPSAPPQAVVNEEFVRAYISPGEPVGRRIGVRGRTYAIAGVVRNSLYNAFGEAPTPIIYFSYRDRPSSSGEIHLRTRPGSETAVAQEVRRVVRELDSELPVYDVRTLNDHIEANLIFRRVPARMFAVLGPLLLVLAAIGIYAVVGYTVSLRTTEIGVRVALGASARRVVGQFVGESLVVIGAGGLLGWTIAAAVAILGSSTARDVPVFIGVPLVLLLVATVASWLPARRAALVDPVVALRHE